MIAPVVPAIIAPVGPIVDEVADVIAPVIPAVVEPLKPVVDLVTDTIAPVIPVVIEPLKPVVDLVTDTVAPVVSIVRETPLAPVVDAVVPVAGLPDHTVSRPVGPAPAAPTAPSSSPQIGSPVAAPLEPGTPTGLGEPAPVDPTVAAQAPAQARRNSMSSAAGGAPIASPSVASYLTTVLPATTLGATLPVMPTSRNGEPVPAPPAAGGSADSVPPLNSGMSPFGAAAGPSPVPPGGVALALAAASLVAALLLTRFTTAPARWRSVFVVSLIERPG